MRTSITTTRKTRHDFIRRVLGEVKGSTDDWHDNYLHINVGRWGQDSKFICSICGREYVQVGEHLKKHYYNHIERRAQIMSNGKGKKISTSEVVQIYLDRKKGLKLIEAAQNSNRSKSVISRLAPAVLKVVDAKDDNEAIRIAETSNIGYWLSKEVLKVREMVKQGLISEPTPQAKQSDYTAENDIPLPAELSVIGSDPQIELEQAYQTFQQALADFVEAEVKKKTEQTLWEQHEHYEGIIAELESKLEVKPSSTFMGMMRSRFGDER